MADQPQTRVAVYIDFDNIVISRYDQLHGRGSFHSDKVRNLPVDGRESKVRTRFREATVDLGAVIDYASSYGSIVLSRAYADWSVPAHAAYREQLLARAVDLVQMFPTTRALKNGADIRLAVDVVEDLFRLDDITHVVIVAGDSDYIALAQRAKRLGKFVVGIGVAGSTSKSLAAACDEFADYDALPGIEPVTVTGEDSAADDNAEPAKAEAKQTATAGQAKKSQKKRRSTSARSGSSQQQGSNERDPADDASGLLERALRILHQKTDDEWLHANVVKEQMKRMDPVFNEKSLGHRSFSEFVAARDALAEVREDGQARLLRLRD
ncbi:MAG TPA: NYN domain-containing protein [Candidatus Agrococcus pullicola]|uniref:NYN domain-containing protein n=1 Tax=Candidatus Agrococcus pullicola TaxID=2838429 RepID=A0A9D1YU69_9MICO|nr:NYN domain-containing protein [Candidatus Agrococcus pullicola]